MARPSPIPFPLSSFPGANPQEGAGRLINCYAEPLGEASKPSAPAPVVWRGSAGLSQHAITPQTGYRGGLLVKNLSYEVFLNTAVTVDVAGVTNILGAFPGAKKVSIARNQAAAPDVVAVDVDNGAYQLSTGGAPAFYNAAGILPQPNGVAFQDGYLFFTIADCRVFATALNSLAMNALTTITIQAKSDVTLLRPIPFSGVMLFFTTGHFEAWQDAANVAPNFPYGRLTIGEKGLIQSAAIAGFETGFSELLWVAQDFRVYWMRPGSLDPGDAVSPPDLDRLIEVQVRAGNLIEAGCYSVGGKKFWHISSPAWSWEINLSTRKWTERWSWKAGQYGRWRATCGHPAFNKWLVGDQQSGNILFVDDVNFSENGSPMLFRIESGPIRDFPQQQRIARADFDFVMGVGAVTGNYQMTVLGTASGTGGNVRLTVNQTSQAKSGDEVQIANVGGTVEANGVFPMTVVDATHIEIPVKFVNAYTAGGTAIDITAPVGAVDPHAAISCSKDGGLSFDNPSLRSIGQQSKTKRSRASVKNRGQGGPMGVRWRIDITDPVYRGLMGASMSSDPREVSP